MRGERTIDERFQAYEAWIADSKNAASTYPDADALRAEGWRLTHAPVGRSLRRLPAAEVDASEAAFDGADLSDADFSGACLAGARFRGARIARARFVGADLSGADFSEASGAGAALWAGANLAGATLPSDAKLPAGESVAEIAKSAQRLHLVLLGACGYSIVALLGIADVELLANHASLKLPIVQVDTPVRSFLFAAPLILAALSVGIGGFLYVLATRLGGFPAVFPDGAHVGAKVPHWFCADFCRRFSNRCYVDPAGALEGWGAVGLWLTLWGAAPTALLVFEYVAWKARNLAAANVASTLGVLTALLALAFYWLTTCAYCRSTGSAARPEMGNPRKNDVGAGVGLAALYIAAAIALWRLAPSPELRAARGDGLSLHNLTLEGLNAEYSHFENADLRGVKAANVPFYYADLSKALMSDATFDGARFDGARMDAVLLTNASLEGAYLRRSDLSKSALDGVRLAHAHLEGANLSDSICDLIEEKQNDPSRIRLDLFHAQLSRAQLKNVQWRGVSFRHADFTESNLTSARFESGPLPRLKNLPQPFGGAVFERADLTGAQFVGVASPTAGSSSLAGSNFQNASAAKAFFEYCNLDRADFQGAKLKGARFLNDTLNGAKFIDADLTSATILGSGLFDRFPGKGVDFNGAILREATLRGDFKGANFSEVDAAGANLRGTHVSESKLYGAKFVKANLSSCTFENIVKWNGQSSLEAIRGSLSEDNRTSFLEANLDGATFENVVLDRVDFSGAILSVAAFTNAKLAAVDFSGANLRGTKFTNVVLRDVDLSEASISKTTEFVNVDCDAKTIAYLRAPRDAALLAKLEKSRRRREGKQPLIVNGSSG